MKTGPEENQNGLKQLLDTWQISDSLPPRFGERVWQRIALEEDTAGESLSSWLAVWVARQLARPAFAVAYLALLLAAGLGAGYWHGQTEKNQIAQQLGVRYVRMMDPYLR